MSLFELLLLALALDAFAVGASVTLMHRSARQVFRLSFHFGLFQGLFAGLGRCRACSSSRSSPCWITGSPSVC